MGANPSTMNRKGILKETLGDHSESINCMALSEDGSILITGSEDLTARMWEVGVDETKCMGVLRGHSSYISSVAIHHIYVVTGSADGTVRKWDMTTCECKFVYNGHVARVQKIICAGDFIYSSSYDTTAKAWAFDTDDIPEGEEDSACVRTFTGHGKGVYPLIYIPFEARSANNDGPHITARDLLITGSADWTARAWSIDDGKCLKIFIGHTGAVTTMSIDADARTLYTAGADSTIKSWNINTGNLLQTMEGHKRDILCMVMANRVMYTGSSDVSARCWVREFGECSKLYKGHQNAVICLKFYKGILFTGCADGVMRAYDAKTGHLLRYYTEHEGGINAITIANDKIYSGSSDSTLRVWDARDISEDPFIEETPPSEPPVLTQAMETMAAQKAYKGQGKTYIHPTMAQHKEDTENAEAETNLVTEDEDITEAKDFEEILSAGEESKFADSKIEDLTLEELVSEE